VGCACKGQQVGRYGVAIGYAGTTRVFGTAATKVDLEVPKNRMEMAHVMHVFEQVRKGFRVC